jgi:hypothetical protein
VTSNVQRDARYTWRACSTARPCLSYAVRSIVSSGAPRVSFKSVPRLPLPPEHRSSRSRSGDGAVAVQDVVQAPSFQVLLGERDDRRRNLVAHQGERYIARVAQPFDGVDAAALGDAEGVAVLSKAFTSMNDSTLVCDSRPAMFRSS